MNPHDVNAYYSPNYNEIVFCRNSVNFCDDMKKF